MLDAYRINRPLKTYHEHNGAVVRPDILRDLGEGRSVALISDAGTPLISDPGYKLVRDVRDAGHAVFAVPGPSALTAAASISGLATDTIMFCGFLPPKSSGRRKRLEEFARFPGTICFYEAPHRLAETLADVANVLPGRAAVVARELTKRFEEVRSGAVAELADWAAAADVKGEIVVLVAAADGPADVGDEDVRAAMLRHLETVSLGAAARRTADELGVPRTRAYDIGIAIRGEARGESD